MYSENQDKVHLTLGTELKTIPGASKQWTLIAPPIETTLNLYGTPPAATLLQESHPIASALPESANGIPEIPPDTPCILDTSGIMHPAL